VTSRRMRSASCSQVSITMRPASTYVHHQRHSGLDLSSPHLCWDRHSTLFVDSAPRVEDLMSSM
jgi:hypothetical protein